MNSAVDTVLLRVTPQLEAALDEFGRLDAIGEFSTSTVRRSFVAAMMAISPQFRESRLKGQ